MDNNLQDFRAFETVQDDLSSLEKLTQSYLLLKKKICGTHDVINQYNDKVKECDRLKADFDTATKQNNKVTYNYNSTLAKVIKLELQNTEYKKNIETLTTQVNDHKIKAAADQQHIQQLICKIKDVEGQQNEKIMQYDLEKSSLQVKTKELEQELRTVKKSYETKLKKMEKKVPVEAGNKPKSKDVGMNTSFTGSIIVQKPKVTEKYVMTDETYNVKDNVYPIFCAKCEALIEVPPVEKICKIMANSCPRLIEKIMSPKKAPSPLQVSTDMNNEQCKTETLTTLSETPPPPHLQSRNNHADFISANLLTSHSSIALNRPDYCNNFPQPSNLMNQSSYYIESTPINPLLTNSSTGNHNNHCGDMATVASSLSLISSLQKRIDTLEMKIKKKLNKRKSAESNSCWQHKHDACCVYEMNSSMHMNFIELWKRMAEFYDKKEEKRFDSRKRGERNSRGSNLSRLKIKKRLQNARTGSWKVESIATKVEHSVPRKRSKKRKHRRSVLLNRSDVSLNNRADSEKSLSDFDADAYFNRDTIVDKTTVSAEVSNSKACFSQPANADETEVVETMRNVMDPNKSGGGETDSGILSDSVESNRFVQLETDVDARLGSAKCRKVTRAKSSIQNAKSHKSENTENFPVKVASHSGKSKSFRDTNDNSDMVLQSDKHTERADDDKAVDASQCNGYIPENNVPTCNNTGSTRRRKVSELQEPKKCMKRGGLLKKLRNLKRSSNTIKKCHNVSSHQDVQNEAEISSASQEPTHLDNEPDNTQDDDYIPRKRPRIAHVPKSTAIEEKVSGNNYLRLRKCLLNNLADTKQTSQIINNIDDTGSHVNATEQTASNCVNLNESSSAIQEIAKEDTVDLSTENLQTKCNNRLQELTSDVLNVNGDAGNGAENKEIPDIKDSFESNLENKSSLFTDLDISGNSDTFATSSADDSFERMLEFHARKMKCTDRYENSVDKKETVTEINDNKHSYRDTASMNTVNQPSADLTPSMALNKNESVANENSSLDKSSESVSEENERPSHYTNNHVTNVTSNSNNPSLNSQTTRLIDAEESDVKESIAKISIKEEKPDTGVRSNSPIPVVKLKQYINETKSPAKNCKSQFKKLFHVRLITDKFIESQLQRLMVNDLQTSVHWDVIEKLKSTCSARIIAKGVVDFLTTEQEFNKTLDNSHTPPAPLMTKAQQRLAAFLVDMEESKPMIIQIVRTGIEYRLFRFNQPIERWIVDSLARMYVVLARIKKDRMKVRIFCCDALYCLGLNAILVLYTVFTCWPEVFPNKETTKELLPKCIAHLVTIQQATGEYPKLHALKNIVSVFYKYQIGTLSKDLLQELLAALREKSHTDIETAIILLAKREGTNWTYKNIIRGALLPMIINSQLPSTYKAFSLLGNLMRAFPKEDADNSVGEIVEQLCDLINSGEGSDEQQEGVISALMSLSRHKFDDVTRCVFEWTPTAPLRDRTVEQMNGLFNLRNTGFWKKYLRKKQTLTAIA